MFYPCTFYIHRTHKNFNITTYPGLTEELISKHLPPSPTTTKGHIKQEFKSICNWYTIPGSQPITWITPKCHQWLLHESGHKRRMRNLRHCRSLLNQVEMRQSIYIYFCYDYDSNTILTETLPSISGACINKGVQKLPGILVTAGKNKLQIIEN